MNKIITVKCPEHDQSEVIEVSQDGEIQWCSRVAGRPVCPRTCITHRDLPEPQSHSVSTTEQPE